MLVGEHQAVSGGIWEQTSGCDPGGDVGVEGQSI